jgi:methylmalonyl-CoA/ethylmalonyl-CoA epimerase
MHFMADSFQGLRQIGQVRVQVTDVDRAVSFYRDTLGLPFLFQFPGMAFFDCDGVRLMLVQPEGRAFGGQSAIYYRVTDIHAAQKALQQRGVTFDDDPHLIYEDDTHAEWMCFFKDPDDNVLALMSSVPKN